MAERGLDLFGDYWRIRRLKYLRLRSLSNPRYRDSGFARKFVSRGRSVNDWSSESPLELLRAATESRLNDYDRAVKKGDGILAEGAWTAFVAAVDALIAEADRLNGSRIKPGAW